MLNLHKRYEATIHIRRGDDRPVGAGDVRPIAEQFDGLRLMFRCAWQFGAGERYPGEFAMVPEAVEVAFGWIASGDLIEVTPC